MMMGTRKLYDFVDNNPDVELYPVEYSNHPITIAKNENVISVNSASEVDLTGQVNAEAIGSRQFSGIGGQLDYVRGAALASNGRSVIAMPSTTKGISKIVTELGAGAVVTTTRCDVDYVVTEYGIAKLKGQSLRSRARRLIAIAHPDHRPELIVYYEKRFHEAYNAAEK